MKKILLMALVAVGIISGCQSSMKHSKSIIDFTTDDKNYKFSLASDDDFATAVMIDSKGEKRILKNAPTGDGIKMSDDNGTSVQFKKGYGILNLNGGPDVNIEYKQ